MRHSTCNRLLAGFDAERLHMLIELAAKFLVGGTLVVTFAIINDTIRPHYAAGIFAAAPSIALANLGITYGVHGPMTVHSEAVGMVAGAIAMVGYVLTAEPAIKRTSALSGSLMTIAVWIILGAAGYFALQAFAP